MEFLKQAVRVISDIDTAELLNDPMRRLILDLLATQEMTEVELAQKLNLSEASVNHHLKELKNARLIEIVRTEAESHGILQKFYRSTATFVILDYRKMPQRIRRYAFVLYLERIRGALSILALTSRSKSGLTWGDLELLADAFAEEVVSVARSIKGLPKAMGKEDLILKIYSQAFLRLSRKSTLDGQLKLLLRSIGID